MIEELDKTMHVSSLMRMDQTYAFCATDYPAASLRVVAKIYAQVLRPKGVPYFPHPGGRRPRGFIAP